MQVDGQYHAPAALRPGNNRGNDPVRGSVGPTAGMEDLEYNAPT